MIGTLMAVFLAAVPQTKQGTCESVRRTCSQAAQSVILSSLELERTALELKVGESSYYQLQASLRALEEDLVVYFRSTGRTAPAHQFGELYEILLREDDRLLGKFDTGWLRNKLSAEPCFARAMKARIEVTESQLIASMAAGADLPVHEIQAIVDELVRDARAHWARSKPRMQPRDDRTTQSKVDDRTKRDCLLAQQ